MSDLGSALLDQLDADDIETLRRRLAVEALPADQPDPLGSAITTREAADRLGVHPETIRRAIRDGKLRATKIGSAIRINPADLADLGFVAACGQPPRPRVRARRPPRSPMKDALAELKSGLEITVS